jgi:hypothetical protein
MYYERYVENTKSIRVVIKIIIPVDLLGGIFW